MQKRINSENLITIGKEIYSSNITFKHSSDQRQQLKEYFLKSFQTQQLLYSLIKDQKTFYQRPEPLRHPLIFYYGHTAAFFINKVIQAGCLQKRFNQHYDSIFAVGVDQNSWDDLNQEHYKWPSVKEVKNYRDQVKSVYLQVLSSIDPQISWNSKMWMMILSIEHQKVHVETSAVIIRRLPISSILPSMVLIDCPQGQIKIQNIPKNKLIPVENFNYVFQMSPETTEVLRWDMELGKKQINIKCFQSSQFLVSNGQFYQFFKDGGYKNLQFWTQQGKKWVSWSKIKHPLFWHLQKQREECKEQEQFIGSIKLRTMNYLRQMPWDWPVEVNNLQARAFCNWKSKKEGKNIRLQSENQYLAIRTKFKEQQNTWKYQQAGNINLEYWFSPCPVNMFKHGDFYDVVGNSWQLLETAIYPYQNFTVNPYYEDFSFPFMDGKHDILRGGSFCSLGNYAMGTYRNFFRRHFYSFSSFRYVVPNEESQPEHFHKESVQLALQNDKFIEKALTDHYINQQSYAFEASKLLQEIVAIQKKGNISGKLLVIGCSVGRLSFSLSKFFEKSYGVDSSVRLFNIAVRLMQQKQIKFKSHDIKVDQNQQQIIEKLRFYQFDPSNLDSNKINNIDFVLIDGLSIKNGTLKKVIHNLLENKEFTNNWFTLCLIECEQRGNYIDKQQLIDMKKGQCQKVIQKQIKGNQKQKIIISCYSFVK